MTTAELVERDVALLLKPTGAGPGVQVVTPARYGPTACEGPLA